MWIEKAIYGWLFGIANLTHLSDVKVKVTDFEILYLSFWLNFLDDYIFWRSLKLSLDVGDTLPNIRY